MLLFANGYCLAGSPSGSSLDDSGGGQGPFAGAGPTGPTPLGSLGGLGEVLGLGGGGGWGDGVGLGGGKGGAMSG